MRSLLALVLCTSVAAGQDEDPLPVAPPPRLKTVATGKAKAAPPKAKVAEPEATPDPTPEPAPKPEAKAEPPPMTPAPKAEPPPEPKTAAKTDPTPEPKADEKAAAPAAGPPPDTTFVDRTLPMYAVYAFAGLAALVVVRTYAIKTRA